VGCAPLALEDAGPRADESFDSGYAPDRILGDGEMVEGPDWAVRAVATPGHTSNHLCLALGGEGALFTGDHVMGWSTTVVSPPDGDMADYMASLDKLLARDDSVYYPAHGPAVEDPHGHVRRLIEHRRMREGQILDHLGRGDGSIPAMVTQMYCDIDPRLHPAAERSVLAHLVEMEARGLARRDHDLWSLA
jgi:glyoxylase-like metal-dependent hydrolase (beta-lactamase superfamily II)